MQDFSRRPLPLLAFALAALGPVPLILAGAAWGGAWAWLAFLYMTLLAATLDGLLPLFRGNAPEGAEFPAADPLLVAVVAGQALVLPAAVLAIAGSSPLDGAGRVALFLGAGLWLGQVVNPAAHELIHRAGRWHFRLGVLAYSALLFGHHASAHRLVHHRHAASAEDPNSARAGEGFYRFFLRAWAGSFAKGLAAEGALRARGGGHGGGFAPHPYLGYALIAVLALVLAHVLAGWAGVAAWAGLSLHAQVQLLLADYVQHYGLTRGTGAGGRLQPVAPRHSWNAPHWFSSAMMLNAPRHSDHHAHPARPYPALRLPASDEAPMLPWPLPMACTLALFPGLWKKRMAPHLAQWSTAP